MQHEPVLAKIEGLKDQMTNMLSQLIRIPAIGPENGGEGELKKAEELTKILHSIGFDKIERNDALDPRVPSGKRPNILAYYYGENKTETLWIVTHMDIVPAGEESLWTMTKPFEPLVKDGKLFGRGSEDNMQPLVGSIYAVKALKDLNIKPKRTIALALVSDEEHGSDYGIKHLIKQQIFHKNDLVIVPDGGNETGDFIEVAEKTILWIKITTSGKQIHASTPDKGLNAHRVGIEYATSLDKLLHEKYSMHDELFDPPVSTFEPTRKDRNVEAVNIIPGEDVTYFDFRILPNYDAEKVLADAYALAHDKENRTGVKIKIEKVQETIAPKPTSPDAPIAVMLKETLEKTRGFKTRIGGIGGGTCAAYFRKADIPAVVWCTVDEVAHQPNEYAKIRNLVDDAKIFALMASS